jgi:hypothetical protein
MVLVPVRQDGLRSPHHDAASERRARRSLAASCVRAPVELISSSPPSLLIGGKSGGDQAGVAGWVVPVTPSTTTAASGAALHILTGSPVECGVQHRCGYRPRPPALNHSGVRRRTPHTHRIPCGVRCAAPLWLFLQSPRRNPQRRQAPHSTSSPGPLMECGGRHRFGFLPVPRDENHSGVARRTPHPHPRPRRASEFSEPIPSQLRPAPLKEYSGLNTAKGEDPGFPVSGP